MAEPAPMDRIAVAAWVVLIVSTLTGVALFVGPVGAPGYFGLIGLHQWVSLALLLLAPLALARHLVHTGSKAGWTGAMILAGGLLAVPVPYLLILPVEEHDAGPVSFLAHSLGALLDGDLGAAYPAIAGLSLLALVALSTVLTVVGLTSRVRERDASRRTGLALTLLVAWAWFSGVLLFFEGVRTLRSAQMFHSFCGCWTAGVLLVHLAARRAATARMPRVAVAAFGLLWLVAFGVIWGVWTRAQGSRYELEVYRTPATPEEWAASIDPTSDWPRVDEARLAGSTSCGAAGCHVQVLEQWRGSPHRFSASNAFYRAAVDELVVEMGMEVAVLCAGCHDPVRALAGTVAQAYEGGVPEESEGVSCVACHAIIGLQSTPPSNGLYRIGLEASYPADPEGRNQAIGRDARRHQTVFASTEAVYSNAPCRVCHRVAHNGIVLQEADMPGADDPDPPQKCRECHLTPEGPITYGHSMAGINADLPLYASGIHPDERPAMETQVVRAMANAGLRARIPLAGSWAPQEPGGSIDELRVVPSLADGALSLAFTTTRGFELEGGHSFPSGPADLNQVWLEVLVRDAEGALLHHVGDLDEGGRIVGTPPRLGARPLAADGSPVEHHRVLLVTDVVDVKLLASVPPGDQQAHRVELVLPEDAAFPLEVRARWLHRRTNPDFAEWALKVSTSPIPTRELAGVEVPVPAP